jgi:hypothetical protein
MKNQTQQIAMYMALGAAITMLVLYFSGQLKFVEYLEGEGEGEEGEEGVEEYEGEEDEDGVEAYESDSDSDSEDEE